MRQVMGTEWVHPFIPDTAARGIRRAGGAAGEVGRREG